mmetsp:Transcript_49616/g.160809  ORF Transcript_49616/g.160809 Transcript_49616/m.160809 type:complete len:265 (-) Transcript_49616:808-1602(-)
MTPPRYDAQSCPSRTGAPRPRKRAKSISTTKKRGTSVAPRRATVPHLPPELLNLSTGSLYWLVSLSPPPARGRERPTLSAAPVPWRTLRRTPSPHCISVPAAAPRGRLSPVPPVPAVPPQPPSSPPHPRSPKPPAPPATAPPPGRVRAAPGPPGLRLCSADQLRRTSSLGRASGSPRGPGLRASPEELQLYWSGLTSMVRPWNSLSLKIWIAFAASRVEPKRTVPKPRDFPPPSCATSACVTLPATLKWSLSSFQDVVYGRLPT